MVVLIRMTVIVTMLSIIFWKTFTMEVVQYMSDVAGLGKVVLPEKEGNWDHSFGTWLLVKSDLVSAHTIGLYVKQENYFEPGRFWKVPLVTHLIWCRHFTFLLCRLIVWAQQHFIFCQINEQNSTLQKITSRIWYVYL